MFSKRFCFSAERRTFFPEPSVWMIRFMLNTRTLEQRLIHSSTGEGQDSAFLEGWKTCTVECLKTIVSHWWAPAQWAKCPSIINIWLLVNVRTYRYWPKRIVGNMFEKINMREVDFKDVSVTINDNYTYACISYIRAATMLRATRVQSLPVFLPLLLPLEARPARSHFTKHISFCPRRWNRS